MRSKGQKEVKSEVSKRSICSRLKSTLSIQNPPDAISKAEQELGTTETIKRLSELLNKTEDLSNVLFVLTPEEHRIAFYYAKDKFSKFITTGTYFLWVAYSFPVELRTELYNIHKHKFSELFKTITDFEHATQCLTSEQKAIELDRFKGLFGKYYTTSAAGLNSNQTPVLSEASSSIEASKRKNELKTEISTSSIAARLNGNRMSVLSEPSSSIKVNTRQKELKTNISERSICSRLKSTLSIQNPPDALSKAEQELGTIETIKRLSELLTKTGDLSNVLFVLTPEEHQIAFDNAKDKFSKFITTGTYFLWVAYSFPIELRTELYNIHKHKFSELFKTITDFEHATQCLTSEQKAVELDRFKEKFGSYYTTSAAGLNSNQAPVLSEAPLKQKMKM